MDREKIEEILELLDLQRQALKAVTAQASNQAAVTNIAAVNNLHDDIEAKVRALLKEDKDADVAKDRLEEKQ